MIIQVLETFLRRRAAAAVLLLALPSLAAAQDEDPDLSRLLFEVAPPGAAQAPVMLPPSPPADEAGEEALGSIADYERSVTRLEAEFGPYANELAEQFEVLASLYEEAGDHARAIETYEKAMHIVRVNNGLFTLRQVDLVENIIQNHEAMMEFREADNHQEYLYYLKQKNYGEDDPEMIRAMFEWADWNVQAYYRRMDDAEDNFRITTSAGAAGPDDYIPVFGPNGNVTYVPRNQLFGPGYAGSPFMRSGLPGNSPDFLIDPNLRTARDLYEEIADTVAEGEDTDESVLPETERKLANISYIVKQEMDYLESRMSSNLYANRTLRTNVSPEISRGYVKGRDGLQKVLQTLRDDPASSPEQIASAIVDLADWHLTFDRPQRAFEDYRTAWDLLAEAGHEQAAIEEFFAPRPAVEVPAYATHRYSRRARGIPADAQVAYRGYIDLKMSVDRYGNPRKVDVVESSENTPFHVREALLEHLDTAKLRPKLVQGETVEQEDIVVRYYYSY